MRSLRLEVAVLLTEMTDWFSEEENGRIRAISKELTETIILPKKCKKGCFLQPNASKSQVMRLDKQTEGKR